MWACAYGAGRSLRCVCVCVHGAARGLGGEGEARTVGVAHVLVEECVCAGDRNERGRAGGRASDAWRRRRSIYGPEELRTRSAHAHVVQSAH